MIPKPEYIYAAELLSVTDGDTIKVRVDLGFCTHVEIAIRLANVFAAERGDPEGTKHTAALKALLPTGSKVVIKTYKTKGAMKTTFGRYIAEVYCDDVCVNEEMCKVIETPQGKGVK